MLSKLKFYIISVLSICVIVGVYKLLQPDPPQHQEEKKQIEEVDKSKETTTKKKVKITKPDGTVIEKEIEENKKEQEKKKTESSTKIISNPVPKLFYGYAFTIKDNKFDFNTHTLHASYRVTNNVAVIAIVELDNKFKHQNTKVGFSIGHK